MAEPEGLSAAAILKGLSGLREDGLLCDVVLKAGENTLSAHRNILAAVSPYFKVLFTGAFKEAEEDTIELHEISFDALARIVDCIYTPGNLELSEANISAMLGAANSLQIPDIMEQCQNFMKSNLSGSNCFLFLKLSEIYNVKDVISLANEYVLANFLTVSKDPAFKEISKDALIAYLDNDVLKTGGSEAEVVKAVVEWLESEDSRIEYTEEVMNHVRFKTINVDKLIEIAEIKLIDEKKECRALVRNALAYHSKMYEKPLVNEIQNKPRGKPGFFVVLNGNGAEWRNSEDNSTWMFPFKGTNIHKAKISERFVRCSMSLVTVNHFLFLFATENESMLPVTMRYDASCGEWLKLNPVPRKGTVGSSAAKLGDDIFLISGMMNVQGNTPEFTDEVFKYKIASNKWVKVANALNKSFQSAATASAVNSCVYLSGGYIDGREQGCVKSNVIAYDTHADLWLVKPSMNHARIDHVMEAFGEKIYILGGRSNTLNDTSVGVPQIEVHDIITEQWTDIEGQILNRWGCTATIISNHVMLILGGTRNEATAKDSLTMKFFDLKKNSNFWERDYCYLKR